LSLDLVPQREEGMTPYEIMLSESQERMLIVAKKDKVEDVRRVFAKWDLDAVIIGQVTDSTRLIVRAGGDIVVDIPVDPVVHLCPVYERPSALPSYIQTKAQMDPVPLPENYNLTLERLLASPTIADKEWVFRQYDHMVQVNTTFLPGADASVLRIKGKKKALAVALDGNALYTFLDPLRGGKIAVAEACRNLACVGAHPVGVTNCLNFGNPEKPEIMWQFQKVIEGIAEACTVFNIPVTGGNVSFYNDTEGESIYPTPVLGVVGILPDMAKAVSPGFKQEGSSIILLGKSKEELGASEYLKHLHTQEKGTPPQLNLDEEKRVQELCIEAITEGLLQSAHDVSEGGLAVCLAECSFLFKEKIGFRVNLEDNIRTDALLFGETQSRICVTVDDKDCEGFLLLAEERRVPAAVIGATGGDRIIIEHRGEDTINIPVAKAFQAWKMAIPNLFTSK